MNPLQVFTSPLSLSMPSAVSLQTNQARKYEQIIQAQMRQNMFPPAYATATATLGRVGRGSLLEAMQATTYDSPFGPLTVPPPIKPPVYVPPVIPVPQGFYDRPTKKEEETVPVNIKESLKGFMSEKLDREDVVKLGLLALVLWWLLRSPRFDGARGEVGGWLKERIGSLLDGGKKEEAKP